MPRKGYKKPGSVRSKAEVDKIFTESYEAVKRAIQAINKKLEAGKALGDEELRFLKKSPSLLASFEGREKAKEEGADVITDEGLKSLVEQYWKLQSLYRKAIGNPKAVLDRNRVLDACGYYRCKACGETHKKGEDCIFTQFSALMKEQ